MCSLSRIVALLAPDCQTWLGASAQALVNSSLPDSRFLLQFVMGRGTLRAEQQSFATAVFIPLFISQPLCLPLYRQWGTHTLLIPALIQTQDLCQL